MKRNYETILKPAYCSGPPSAHSYQIYKLQALKNSQGGLYSKLTKLNVWSARHPLLLATGIATVKSGVCDYIAQTGIEGRNWDTFNWSRFTLFSLFGMYVFIKRTRLFISDILKLSDVLLCDSGIIIISPGFNLTF